MKIWDKNSAAAGLPEILEKFTIGRDQEFDMHLAEHDVLGSLAHTEMLAKAGLLTDEELNKVQQGLKTILEEIRNGEFAISEGVEDIHSQVEITLTERIGEAGKKIHSGRSRNDQVLLDIKLFLRAELKKLAAEVNMVFDQFLSLSEENKDKLYPGYTHMQAAMPSSFGLWFGAYAESLAEDMEMLAAAWKLCDKNPLGSGAGYGSSFPLDRNMTTELLGFHSMHYNVVNAQMSRGKTEKWVAMALSAIAATLSKFSYDAVMYMGNDMGFVSFPDALTTGSSIMPHKKNPDVFELIRGKCNRLQALPNEITLLINNLPSGYHRDLQLTKECLFPALAEMHAILEACSYMLRHIRVHESLAGQQKYNGIYSVEKVNAYVLQGLPFREAYKKVASEIEDGSFEPPASLRHTHQGSMGNLCTEDIRAQMKSVLKNFGTF